MGRPARRRRTGRAPGARACGVGRRTFRRGDCERESARAEVESGAMKYCEIDGLRYPDSLSDCTACGARLVSFDSSPDFLTTPQVVATSCCPNPLCRALVAPPQANFCALCAHRLKPISFDIWVNKVAEPALRGNPVEVLLDPTGVLRPAAELGLPL